MKRLCLFLTLIFATVLSSAHAEQRESAYARVMRTGTIRCGYAISPPMMMKDPNTGAITGADHDIIEAVGRELGLKIEWTEEAGWGNFIEGLRGGRYDAFCSEQWEDEARPRFQTLSDPIIYEPMYPYVRIDDHRFDGHIEKADDPSVKIPGVDGDVTMKIAQSGFPKASVLTLPQTATVSDMFLSVMTKKADIVFLAPSMFREFEKTNKGKLRRVDVTEPPFVFGARYGFNSGEIQLRDMVNVALRSLIDNGRVDKIAHGYSPDYIIAKKNY